MDSTFDENHRARELLGRMTLEEKAALVVGRDLWTTQPVERLGIRSIWLSDGPHGLRKVSIPTWESRKSEPATCFPTESALAASWDVELAREVGRAIGIEAQALDVQIVLAPGVNLKRSPLGGRNFEYFSEDPVLAGELAAAYVNGLQGEGVGASLKHFVANENETDRFSADSIVDERTLRELYLRPFETGPTAPRIVGSCTTSSRPTGDSGASSSRTGLPSTIASLGSRPGFTSRCPMAPRRPASCQQPGADSSTRVGSTRSSRSYSLSSSGPMPTGGRTFRSMTRNITGSPVGSPGIALSCSRTTLGFCHSEATKSRVWR